jgi:serine/threonine-protein kinase RsbW
LITPIRRAAMVRVRVRDHGRWRAPGANTGWRGRGLAVILGIAEQVDLRCGNTGTSLEMRWHL